MDRIGRIYTLEKAKKDLKQSKRPLCAQELSMVFDQWGDVALVAALMEYTPNTIRRWIANKKIKASKGPDGRWYIPLKQFATMFDIDSAAKHSPLGTLRPNRNAKGLVRNP